MFRFSWLFGSIVVLCLATPAAAMEQGEWSLDINGISWHSKDTYDDNGVQREYNESNPGAGFSYAWKDDWDIRAGGFENSYDEDSFYAGVHWHKDYYMGDWTWAPGVNFFLISGYERRTDVPAVILPTITFGHKAMKLSLGLLPFGDEASVATLQLQLNFKHF